MDISICGYLFLHKGVSWIQRAYYPSRNEESASWEKLRTVDSLPQIYSGHRLVQAMVALQCPQSFSCEGMLAWARVLSFQVLFLTACITRPTWNFHTVVLATWDEEGSFTREEEKWEGERETEKEAGGCHAYSQGSSPKTQHDPEKNAYLKSLSW